jgi:CubicO group peptidase (beta-lactamase class C family)
MRTAWACGFLVLTACSSSSSSDNWPAHEWTHGTPEQAGVSSRSLVTLLDAVAGANAELHEVLIARHGTVALDAQFFPYDGTRPHDVASVTKTLTALAVGRALHTGALSSVDSALLSFFPDAAIENDGADKRAITLADLLTMRSGLQCESDVASVQGMTSSASCVQYGLDLTMDAAPGTRWAYCSAGPHLLSAVVGRATATPEDAWLRSEVFDPIGVGDVIWPRDAQGVAHGWGDARLHAEDLARIGDLMLSKGTWDHQTIVDAAWLAAATTNQVGAQAPPDGYGYLTWPRAAGGFYANGRGGQYVFVLPEQGLVVVTLGAATPDVAHTYGGILANQLLPALRDAPLPADPEGDAMLADAVARVAQPPAANPPPSPPAVTAEVDGVLWTTDANQLGWTSLSVSWSTDQATVTLGIGATWTAFDVGLDGVPRVTRSIVLDTDARHSDLDIAAVGSWTSATSFEITYDTIDRIDAGTITLDFASPGVQVDVYERTYLLEDIAFGGERSGSP